MAYYVIFAPVC